MKLIGFFIFINMDSERSLTILNAEEQRVLGALIEKSICTPDYYPMTLNSLTAACNQKSSRKPVVEYDEATVVLSLNSLKAKGLIATATGVGIRGVKYKHNFTTVFDFSNGEIAILCLLFLRGPQTPGELNTNSGRLHDFPSIESVNETLNHLAEGETPYVKELPKRAGQKETRFTHLFGETILDTEDEVAIEPARKSVNDMENRLTLVENELADVKQKLEKLMKELLG